MCVTSSTRKHVFCSRQTDQSALGHARSPPRSRCHRSSQNHSHPRRSPRRLAPTTSRLLLWASRRLATARLRRLRRSTLRARVSCMKRRRQACSSFIRLVCIRMSACVFRVVCMCVLCIHTQRSAQACDDFVICRWVDGSSVSMSLSVCSLQNRVADNGHLTSTQSVIYASMCVFACMLIYSGDMLLFAYVHMYIACIHTNVRAHIHTLRRCVLARRPAGHRRPFHSEYTHIHTRSITAYMQNMMFSTIKCMFFACAHMCAMRSRNESDTRT